MKINPKIFGRNGVSSNRSLLAGLGLLLADEARGQVNGEVRVFRRRIRRSGIGGKA
jgi:hypothetical protein